MTPEELARYERIQSAWEHRREYKNPQTLRRKLAELGAAICQEAFLPTVEFMTWFWEPIAGPLVYGIPPVALQIVLWENPTRLSGLHMKTAKWGQRLTTMLRGNIGTVTLAPVMIPPDAVRIQWINAAKSEPATRVTLESTMVDPTLLFVSPQDPLISLWQVMTRDFEAAVAQKNIGRFPRWWQ